MFSFVHVLSMLASTSYQFLSAITVIKNKLGNASSVDNYRPIAITTIFSKLLESVILQTCKDRLETSSNQFGFKLGHSTELCTFVFRNLIDYYLSNSSPVFVSYLDASKAFDKVNYWILLKKLVSRNFPLSIIKLLVFWFSHQLYCVKWGGSFSDSFTVANGVRQGGILSPYLFNVYMDELSVNLSKSQTGCMFDDKFVNHLFYADDAVLLSPSANGLQKLLNISENYASSHDITFNVQKTVCMCFRQKWMKGYNMPSVYLNGCKLKYVHTYKYLGNHYKDDCSDDADITQKIRSIYSRGNSLIKNLKFCSDDVKYVLFKTYCENIYGCALWTMYKMKSIRSARVAYNNVFRKFLGLNRNTSISFVMVSNNVNPFNVIHRLSINSLIDRLKTCSNILTAIIYNS